MHRKSFISPPSKVALFVTCMVDMMYPQVGIATVELLEMQGVEVVFPEGQTCCGQPAFNSGYRDEAVQMATHFLDVFYPLVENGEIEAIVVPSGSCGTMTSHFYTGLLQDAGEQRYRAQAEVLSEITFELTEFLVDVLNIQDLPCSYPGKVTYHACCHLLRELSVDQQPRQLLSQSGVDFVEMEGSAECCGFGGLFAVKNEPISTAMGKAKLQNAAGSGADIVTMCDVSCMTHIQGLMHRQQSGQRAVHIAELLNLQPGASPFETLGTHRKAPESAQDLPPVPSRRWQDIKLDGDDAR